VQHLLKNPIVPPVLVKIPIAPLLWLYREVQEISQRPCPSGLSLCALVLHMQIPLHPPYVHNRDRKETLTSPKHSAPN
jgi:hypothetical protein